MSLGLPEPTLTDQSTSARPLSPRKSDLLSTTKGAELELLNGAPRRRMVVASGIDQDEVPPEDCGQSGRVMAHDRQTAASLRPVRREGPDDDVSPWPESLLEFIDVSRLISLIGQEVECSAVMPQIVRLCRLPFGDVSDHPSDVSAAVAADVSSLRQARLRKDPER